MLTFTLSRLSKSFQLLGLPYPSNSDAVLERLQSNQLLQKNSQGWTIPNLSAITLAKRLESFSSTLARKAPRVIIYEGNGKMITKQEKTGNKGYAVGLQD